MKELIALLTKLNVHFVQISEDEIVIDAPADYAKDPLVSQFEIAKDPKSATITDESFIHIAYNKEYDSYDWLVAVKDYIED